MPAFRKGRISRLAARALLVLLGLVFGCLIGEAVLRLGGDPGLAVTRKDPVLGQKYRPSYDAEIYEAEAGERVHIRINSLGFRDREHEPGRSAAKRVVFLGDSFVAGFSVPFEDNLAQVAERSLGALSGERWEAINLGVAGFGTAQEMLAYREYGRRFAPDVVVLCFFAGNDVSDNSSELSTNPRVYYRLGAGGRLEPEPRSRVRRGLSRLLNEHSRLYVWQKQQTARIAQHFRKRVVLNPVHRVFLSAEDPAVERAWDLTRALIREVRSMVEADGGRFLLVYVPLSDEVNPDWWRETLAGSPRMQEEEWDLGKPERIVAALAREDGIDLLSPRDFFLDEAERSGTRYYFEHGHFNAAGHRALGERIARSILELPAGTAR